MSVHVKARANGLKMKLDFHNFSCDCLFVCDSLLLHLNSKKKIIE